MNDVDYEEALEILGKPKFCEDAADWVMIRQKGQDSFVLQNGLLDETGVSIGMNVILKVHRSKKTGLASYSFGLFRVNLIELERTYMVEAKQSPKKIKDLHSLPHEHIGNVRQNLEKGMTIDFKTLMARFCKQTNIIFSPSVIEPGEEPENFRLR